MNPLQAGLIGGLLLLILLVASLPVAFSMAVAGFIGFALLRGLSAASSMLVLDVYESFASYSLMVIPLFILMGQICFHSGISRRLFSAAYHWFGHWRGGLAVASIGACAAFGAICGSGPATAATMASVALPEMKRYKYSSELACGTVASGGSLGMLIPPSVVFMVYALLTEQSIGKLFISGVVPGIIIAILFTGVVVIQCWRKPALGPAGPKFGLVDRLKALSGVTETLILFILVMVGMFMGFFSPTEAAAVGAGCSIVIAAFRGSLSFKMLKQALFETLRSSIMVMIIVSGAAVFGRFLAITRIPFQLANWLVALTLPAWVIMGFIIIFYLIAGCFIDALALIMLTIPIFYPVVLQLGFDPIWFGVIIVVVTQMGVITPPVGVNAYVVAGIERDIPLQAIFRGCLPFVGALIVAVALFMVFPQLCTFLPELVY